MDRVQDKPSFSSVPVIDTTENDVRHRRSHPSSKWIDESDHEERVRFHYPTNKVTGNKAAIASASFLHWIVKGLWNRTSGPMKRFFHGFAALFSLAVTGPTVPWRVEAFSLVHSGRRAVSSTGSWPPSQRWFVGGEVPQQQQQQRLYSALIDDVDDVKNDSTSNESGDDATEATKKSSVVEAEIVVESVIDPKLSSSSEPQQQRQQYSNDNWVFLHSLGAITGRGEFATPLQKQSAHKVLCAMEATNPTEYPTQTFSSASLLSGTWELVYTNTQLFRSSPFFMSGRAVCTTPDAIRQYNWFCDMHRAALSMSSIQAVRQIIDANKNRLTSEFEVRAGTIPFLSSVFPSIQYSGGAPVAIVGALVSTADIAETPNGTAWEVYMDTVQVKGSNIPGLRQLLDMENVKLQSRSLANVLEQTVASYTTPKAIFRTTYLDDRYRIARDQDDNVFLYVKTSNSTEPTDYRSVDADLGVARLLEGFNDAVTRFYI